MDDRPLRLVAANPLDRLARTLEALLVVAGQPLSVAEMALSLFAVNEGFLDDERSG